MTPDTFKNWRFNREARLVSGFTHPNTVRLIDFGESGVAHRLQAAPHGDDERGFRRLRLVAVAEKAVADDLVGAALDLRQCVTDEDQPGCYLPASRLEAKSTISS